MGSRRRFRYEDSRGKRITDPDKLERIEELVIPPAWRDVWISPRPNAKLQATGIDAAGRRQYLYHPEYRARQEQAKYDKLVRFAEHLPDIRKAMSKDLDREEFTPEWTCALAVKLINLGWFRVGADRYTKRHRSYGITTLNKSHVSVRGSRVSFKYRGKHKVWARTAIVDAELAEAMKALRSLEGGRRLFRYELPDGTYCNLSTPQAERVHPRAHGRGVHREGLPDLGRNADRRRRLCRTRSAGDRDGDQATRGGGDAHRRRATR